DVMELMYVCLALGFEGKLRITGRGTSEHSRLRDGVYRILRERRGEFERELSPHWRGLAAGHRPLTSYIPAWVIAAVTAAVLMLMFMGFTYALNDLSNDAYADLAQLPPVGAVGLARVAPPPPPPPPPAPNTFTKFLEPEIKQGLVTVDENAQRILVRITGDGMFESGSDKLDPKYLSIMTRVGKAMETAVTPGNTHHAPIKTLPCPSTVELGAARPESAAKTAMGQRPDPAGGRAGGRGAGEPIADNKTPEGKRQNRRIELIVMKPAEA